MIVYIDNPKEYKIKGTVEFIVVAVYKLNVQRSFSLHILVMSNL